jgi:hypothetical protein
MTQLPILISGAQFQRLGVFEEQTDEAAPLGDFREAGFRTIRSEQPFAFAQRAELGDRNGMFSGNR